MTAAVDNTNAIQPAPSYTVKLTNGTEYHIILIEDYLESDIDANANSLAELMLRLNDEDDKIEIVDREKVDNQFVELILQRAAAQVDSRIGLTRDQIIISRELLKFYGATNIIKDKDSEDYNKAIAKIKADTRLTEEEKYGTAKGMSIEDFLKVHDRIDIYSSLQHLRYRHGDVKQLAGRIDTVSEEQINNLLGHLGIVTSVNETTNLYQCIIMLKGGYMMHVGRNRAAVALRGYLSRLSGSFYTNNGLLKELVTYWMTINDIKDNPLDPSKETLNALSAKLGTSIDEIEQHYQDELAKAEEVIQ